MTKKGDFEQLIHPGLQRRIVAPLAVVLTDAVVFGNFMLSSETRGRMRDLDGLLPAHGPQRDRLDAIIGPHPLSQFVIGRIEETFRPLRYEEGTRKLTAYEGYEDPSAAAIRLAAEFSSLPQHYIYSIPLTGIFRDAIEDNHKLPFSEEVGIYGGGELLKSWLPLSSGNDKIDDRIFGRGLLQDGRREDWCGAFLLVKEQGFSAEHTENEGDQRVIETIKSFFGLYMAHNLIERRYTPAPRPGNVRVSVHRLENGEYKLYRQFPLDDATSALIHELHFDDQKGQFENPRMKRALVVELGAHVAKAFARGLEAEKIKLAGRWLFDSYAGGNQLMSFLQAMVVLEIILGDKAASDKIGLGELLRNRCAYLLGKSAQERADIMAEFGRIYEVRSAIVHRGKSLIRATERPLFFKLRSFAQQVIRAELLLLPSSPHYVSSAVAELEEIARLAHHSTVEAGLRAADTITTRR